MGLGDRSSAGQGRDGLALGSRLRGEPGSLDFGKPWHPFLGGPAKPNRGTGFNRAGCVGD